MTDQGYDIEQEGIHPGGVRIDHGSVKSFKLHYSPEEAEMQRTRIDVERLGRIAELEEALAGLLATVEHQDTELRTIALDHAMRWGKDILEAGSEDDMDHLDVVKMAEDFLAFLKGSTVQPTVDVVPIRPSSDSFGYQGRIEENMPIAFELKDHPDKIWRIAGVSASEVDGQDWVTLAYGHRMMTMSQSDFREQARSL